MPKQVALSQIYIVRWTNRDISSPVWLLSQTDYNSGVTKVAEITHFIFDDVHKGLYLPEKEKKITFHTIKPPCKHIPFVLSGYLAVLQADEWAPYRINFKMCQMWRRLNYCFISNNGQQRHVSAHRCLSKSIMLIKLHARVCVWLYACVSFPLPRGRRFVEVLNEQLALVLCL